MSTATLEPPKQKIQEFSVEELVDPSEVQAPHVEKRFVAKPGPLAQKSPPMGWEYEPTLPEFPVDWEPETPEGGNTRTLWATHAKQVENHYATADALRTMADEIQSARESRAPLRRLSVEELPSWGRWEQARKTGFAKIHNEIREERAEEKAVVQKEIVCCHNCTGHSGVRKQGRIAKLIDKVCDKLLKNS